MDAFVPQSTFYLNEDISSSMRGGLSSNSSTSKYDRPRISDAIPSGLSNDSSTSKRDESWMPDTWTTTDTYASMNAWGDDSNPSQQSISNEGAEYKHTPNSLGWTADTRLLDLYEFVIIKGGEPYLSLKSRYTEVARSTPARVYLNAPENPVKGQYPCQYPAPCTSQRTSQPTIFSRAADLERHYKLVHVKMDNNYFPCDYTKCGRSTEPFARKQFYRDHLREYHKEDFGNPKGYKKMSIEELDQARRQWLMNQKISRGWWRCEKCLRRIRVAEGGWSCRSCGIQCEDDRRKNREELKPSVES